MKIDSIDRLDSAVGEFADAFVTARESQLRREIGRFLEKAKDNFVHERDSHVAG